MGREEVVLLEKGEEMEVEEEKKSGGGGGGGGVMALLPRMPMRVLLVEGDYSTRQIIAALLRKCGYQVVAASDGIKAWEALKGKSCSIDLVLTEVELPLMSGFVLLSMIMEDETCKNIPVIMMSSHDSMSMVFKCMMKGAVDFLVKPIRKNELRNLWQHVWRRQIASGGVDVKESGDHDGNLATTLEQRAHLALLIENVAGELRNDQGSSGHESDAQSSCTRSDMEAESKHVQTMLEFKQPTRRNLSTPNDANIQNAEENNKTSRDKGIAPTRSPDCNDDVREKASTGTEKVRMIENRVSDKTGDNAGERSSEDNDVKCSGDNTEERSSEDNDVKFSGGHVPHLELSLQGFEYRRSDKQEKYEKTSLNHSSSSPFSFYNCRNVHTSGNASDAPSCSGSAASLDLETMPVDSASIPQDVTAGRRTSVRVLPSDVPVGGLPFHRSSYWNGPAMPSMFYPKSAPPVWSSSGSIWQAATGWTNPNNLKSTDTEDIQDQNVSHSCHSVEDHDNAELCSDEQRLAPSKTGDSTSTSRNDNAKAPLICSSYDCASHGITGHIDSCNRLKTIPEIAASDGLLSQRELALNRFRLKRKERCFEKKVRYQSRKLLAEQRPRVKGQFIRQDQLV